MSIIDDFFSNIHRTINQKSYIVYRTLNYKTLRSLIEIKSTQKSMKLI